MSGSDGLRKYETVLLEAERKRQERRQAVISGLWAVGILLLCAVVWAIVKM